MKVKQIRLDSNTIEELKELAAKEDRSVNSVIRDAVEQYLASKKQKAPVMTKELKRAIEQLIETKFTQLVTKHEPIEKPINAGKSIEEIMKEQNIEEPQPINWGESIKQQLSINNGGGNA